MQSQTPVININADDTGPASATLRLTRYVERGMNILNYPFDARLISITNLPQVTGYPLQFSTAEGEPVLFRVAVSPMEGQPRVEALIRQFEIRDLTRNKIVIKGNCAAPFSVRVESPRSYRDEGAEFSTEICLDCPGLSTGFYELIISDGNQYSSKRIVFSKRPGMNEIEYDCVCILPTFTWQAYNYCGGGSFYTPNIGDPRVASNLRPIAQANFNSPEVGCLPIIKHLVKLGLRVAFIDNTDVHNGLLDAKRYRLAIMVTHDEYFTLEMRAAFDRFLELKGHVLIVGGNTCCRVTRIEGNNIFDTKTPEQDYWGGAQAKQPTETTFGLAWSFGGYPLHRVPMVQVSLGIQPPAELIKLGRGMKVISPQHPVYAGTGLLENDILGADCEIMYCEADGVCLNIRGRVDRVTCPNVPKKAVVLASGLVVNPGHDRGLREVGVMIDCHVANGRVINMGSMGWYRAFTAGDVTAIRVVTNALNELGISVSKKFGKQWQLLT